MFWLDLGVCGERRVALKPLRVTARQNQGVSFVGHAHVPLKITKLAQFHLTKLFITLRRIVLRVAMALRGATLRRLDHQSTSTTYSAPLRCRHKFFDSDGRRSSTRLAVVLKFQLFFLSDGKIGVYPALMMLSGTLMTQGPSRCDSWKSASERTSITTRLLVPRKRFINSNRLPQLISSLYSGAFFASENAFLF